MAQRTAAATRTAAAAAAAHPHPHADAAATPAAASSSTSPSTAALAAAGLTEARAAAKRDSLTFWRFILPLGVTLRLLLSAVLRASDLHASLSSRGELTNALVSFAAVRESVSNVQVAGADPYAGLSCSHAPPLLLALFTAISDVPDNAAHAARGLAMFASPGHLAMLAAWVAIDCVIALLLFALASDYHARFPSQSAALLWSQALWRSNRVVRHLPLWIAAVYLLNPVTMASCVIFNLSHLTHLSLAAMLLAAARGRPVATGALLGLCAYLDMYPLLALGPVLLLAHKGKFAAHPRQFPQYDLDRLIRNDQCRFLAEGEGGGISAQCHADADAGADGAVVDPDPLSEGARARSQRDSSLTHQRVLKVAFQPVELPAGAEIDDDDAAAGALTAAERAVAVPSDAALGVVESSSRWSAPFLCACTAAFALSVSLLLYLSFLVSGSSWSFLESSYGYSLLVPSLSPTYSLFWYFFVAMFDRFHTFFLVLFHAHVLVYLLPLSLRFRDEPLFLAAVVLHTLEVFRSYPTLGGLLFTSLLLVLLQLPLLLLTLRRIYLVVFLNLVAVITQALMRFLWLDSGGGNANFMYFQHTLFMFAHLVCVMECIGAMRRRQAAVLEGQVQETIDRRREARRAIARSSSASDSDNDATASQPAAEGKKQV